MGDKRLRKECVVKVRRLALPATLDIPGLCAHLEAIRRRPITLMALPDLGPRGPCGVWVATPDTDFVLYHDDTSPLHQAHIILHELSHLIFDHSHGLEGDYQQLLLPNLEHTAIRRILGRSAYTMREEREAEIMASVLAQWIARAATETGEDDRGLAGSDRYQTLKKLLE